MTDSDLGFRLPDLDSSAEAPESTAPPVKALSSAILRIPVSVQIVIGTARLPLSQVAQLAPGATLTLDEKLGTPARMLVNGREVARGDLFVLEGSDGRLGLTIREVSGTEPAA